MKTSRNKEGPLKVLDKFNLFLSEENTTTLKITKLENM